jgi:hypothetical protein
MVMTSFYLIAVSIWYHLNDIHFVIDMAITLIVGILLYYNFILKIIVYQMGASVVLTKERRMV